MLVFPIKSKSNIEIRLLFVDTCFNYILFTESVLKVLPNSNDSKVLDEALLDPHCYGSAETRLCILCSQDLSTDTIL